jgi:hypothetical protein
MSQTGYTPIALYSSATASAVPTAGNLIAGELAINTNDGRLFYKDSAGVVQVLATKGSATVGGSTTQVQYNNAGVLAGSANFVFDGTNVGIGTSSPGFKLDVAAAQGIVRNTSTTGINAVDYRVINTGGTTYFGRDDSTGSSFGSSAYATVIYSGGAYPMAFFTNATERMRIDSSGNLLLGSTAYNGANQGGTQIGGGNVSAIYVGHANGTASGNPYMQYNYNGGGIGSITQNGTTGVLYNLTSDYRLKDNPIPLTGSSEFIMALQPKTWDWWDGSGKGVGFIAHEFMEVAKYSGNGEKDAIDAEGKPVYQSIQPSSSEVMANLVALVQEQQAMIETLTTRLNALESK